MESNESIKTYTPGSVIVKEHFLSRKLYIIYEGKVRVYKTYYNRKVTLAVLGKGEIFGELSFFDAEPRSASVEALTEVKVKVLDGEQSLKQIEDLPDWIHPIFKSVFERFRKLDQQVTVLQSAYDFQKRSMGRDNIQLIIYKEFARYLKVISMLVEKYESDKAVLTKQKYFDELDVMLGKRFISLKIFTRLLVENHIIDNDAYENKGIIQVDMNTFTCLDEYINEEMKSGRLRLLGHPAIAILRKIVAILDVKEVNDNNGDLKDIFYDQIDLKGTPLYDEGLDELLKQQIVLNLDEHKLSMHTSGLYKLYVYQSMLKSFDHTIMQLEN